jgi:hypothetical protein
MIRTVLTTDSLVEFLFCNPSLQKQNIKSVIFNMHKQDRILFQLANQLNDLLKSSGIHVLTFVRL